MANRFHGRSSDKTGPPPPGPVSSQSTPLSASETTSILLTRSGALGAVGTEGRVRLPAQSARAGEGRRDGSHDMDMKPRYLPERRASLLCCCPRAHFTPVRVVGGGRTPGDTGGTAVTLAARLRRSKLPSSSLCPRA